MEKNFIISFKWALNEDQLSSSEMQEITVGSGYTFADFLQDRNVSFEQSENTFYVLDDFKEKTGEVYIVYSVKEVFDMESIRDFIAEKFDGGCWEQITASIKQGDEFVSLHKFDDVIVFEGEYIHCIIISEYKCNADGDVVETRDIYELYS